MRLLCNNWHAGNRQNIQNHAQLVNKERDLLMQKKRMDEDDMHVTSIFSLSFL